MCIDLRQERCLDFLTCVQISILVKNVNLDTHTSPNFLKCVRKSIHSLENLDRYVCLDLRFEENENLKTLEESGRTEIIGGFQLPNLS